jgi:hypothetical protein
MPVIVSYQEAINSAAILTAAWWLHRHIGLFQNDWQPQNYQGISAVVPATFSGYPGLQPISGWSAPVQVGAQAIVTAPQWIWTHDGGPVGNAVFGIYVVDDSGNLCWAERFPQNGIQLVGAGQFVTYVPTVALQSIFPSW